MALNGFMDISGVSSPHKNVLDRQFFEHNVKTASITTKRPLTVPYLPTSLTLGSIFWQSLPCTKLKCWTFTVISLYANSKAVNYTASIVIPSPYLMTSLTHVALYEILRGGCLESL